ncbi:hypothetical protein COCSUDRAFT_54088 [Coccomyxa subellipsoidea C-169]|uniref:Uncharacterized protein n=1 Tax=Coccomyxa subellipsoidea (strain C-169) TaxID=574566 RepID=I0YRH9_COCSC|nr:hypothetical protein COCSUDRAFT_54088 [Coccomyxa subellipsoidea C-169]EIE20998.1 hypothetical protein COCSUDRAFT_54088 [Coccomyxa subellipsoidea C-169]|eukprot:XP_005645542.1 hypothetical protein COCSUDRAFT_54088 [Coccomyxa subellipsoidea C-169]
MQPLNNIAWGRSLRKTCAVRWNSGVFAMSARKDSRTKLPSVTRAVQFGSLQFDDPETFITFMKSPYGQKQIKHILEDDRVSQERKDAISTLIPELFLPDTSELPVYLHGSDREIIATKPIDRAPLLRCSTRTELEIILKRHMNIAEDVPVKLYYDFGLKPSDQDAWFVPDVEYGLTENLEAAGHISVTILEDAGRATKS